MAVWRLWIALAGMALLAVAVASIASAGPDPPFLDGGTTTFPGDWDVDPSDALAYVNQTIVLDGNLTVFDNGTLTLSNCTLVMNCSFDGQHAIDVLANGSMVVSNGSVVRCPSTMGVLGPRFQWTVRDAGHLAVVGSAIVGAGWDDAHPGLVLMGPGGVIDNSTVTDCHRGVTLEAAPASVAGTIFLRCVVGVMCTAPHTNLTNVSFYECPSVGVWLSGCDGCVLSHVRVQDSGEGVRAGPGCANITVLDAIVTNATVGLNISAGGSRVEGLIARDCDVGLLLGASRSTAMNVSFTSGPFHLTPTAGVHVLGPALDVVLVNLSVDGARDGLLVEGAVANLTLTGLTVLSALDGGVAVVGSGAATTGLRLEHLDLRVGGAGYGISLQDARNVTLYDVVVSGPPVIGIDVRACAAVRLEKVDASGVQRVVSVFCEGELGDVDIVQSSLTGADYGLWAQDTANVTLSATTISGSSMDCVLARRSPNMTVELSIVMDGLRSGLEAFDCDGLRLVSSVFDDSPYNIYIQGSSDVFVSECFVMSCDEGVWLSGCMDVSVMDTDVIDAMVAYRLNATLGSRLVNCTASRVSDTGLVLEDGTSGTLVTGSDVTDCLTGVRLLGASTSSNTLEDITFQDCTEGVNATGTGGTNLVTGTSFAGMTTGVSAMAGSRMVVEGGTFTDCDTALLTDASSWLNWTVTGSSDLSNCSARFRGIVTVKNGGRLNVTRSRLTLLSTVPLGSSITADAVSFLRLDGSTFEAAAPLEGYQITSSGDLEVTGCTLVGGGSDGGSGGGGGGGPSGWAAALDVRGSGARLDTTTFLDCAVAIDLEGDFATVDSCDITGPHGIRLNRTSRSTIANCDIRTSGMCIWGTFNESMALLTSRLEGTGVGPTGIEVVSVVGVRSTLTMRNVTMLNMTGPTSGLRDAHAGSTLVEDCSFLRTTVVELRLPSTAVVQLRRTTLLNATMAVHGASFIVEDCTLNSSTASFHNASQGGVIRDSTFERGASGGGTVALHNCQYVTLEGLHVTDALLALGLWSGSGASCHGSAFIDVVEGVDVNSSQLQMDACEVTNHTTLGVEASGTSAQLGMANCTIVRAVNTTGPSVSSVSNAEVNLLNTTFDKSAVRTSDTGRLTVRWFATFELQLPWGGLLVTPSLFTVRDAGDGEVINATRVDTVFTLSEFVEDSGVRIHLTPHAVRVEDAVRGVGWWGDVTFDRSLQVVIELGDGRPPVARAGMDQVVDEDTIVSLDGRGSLDNDPTFGDTGGFVWSFDEYGTFVQLTGEQVEYVFSVPGQFNVTLTVKDAAGNVATDDLVVQVRDRTPPTINYIGNVTIDEDVRTVFDASASTDNDPRFDVLKGRFVWRFSTPLGQTTLEGATVYLTFADPGLVDGSLTVYDMELNTAEVVFSVRVLDRTPPEIVGLRDMTLYAPTSGLLDASLSSDNVGIASFRWSIAFPPNTTVLTGPAPEFMFDRLGVYTVVLEVVDGAGNTNSTSATFVYDDVPVLEAPSYVVAMALERLEVPVGVHDTFNTHLVFRVASGPAGAEVVGGAGDARLVWTPQASHANSSVTIDVVLNDGFVDSLARVIVWVNPARGDANHAPEITSEPPLAAKRATPYIYSVAASDPDGDRLWFLLEQGPDGMSLSSEGTLSWDPPFETGTVLVAVRVVVTDGRAMARQSWVVRFREPPNQAPLITFLLPDLEVKVREEFVIDLGPFMPDGGAYQVDPDDPNLALEWSVSYNASVVTMLQKDALAFRFLALDVPCEVELTFRVVDASGASDDIAMRLTVLQPPRPAEKVAWWLWALAAIVVIGAGGIATVGIASSRRRRRLSVVEARRRAHAEMEAAHPVEGVSEGAAEGAAERDVERAVTSPGRTGMTTPGATAGATAGAAAGTGTGVTVAPPHAVAHTTEEISDEVAGDIITDELDELIAEVGTFHEVRAVPRGPRFVTATPKPATVSPSGGSHGADEGLELAYDDAEDGDAGVAEAEEAPEPRPQARPFVLEGVAVIGKDGRPLALTGRVEEVLAPVQKALLDALSSQGTIADATLEVEGRRVILTAKDGVGVLGVIRGREDADLRSQLGAALENLLAQPDKDAAVHVIDDLVAATGTGATAEVVKGAWTAHVRASVGFKGEHVVLEVFLRNDTQELMHNVRVDLSYDHDALSLVQVRPRLLVSQDRISVGNVPTGKSTELEVLLAAEACLSSPMSVQASYTDVEGRRVLVPTRPMVVDVRPPPIGAGGSPSDAELLELATGGLPHAGRKVFSHAPEVGRADLHASAVGQVRRSGLQQVKAIDSTETMRTETWLAGVVPEGGARVVARVSTHGTDRLLEVFAASDDASAVVGLLTWLNANILDAVRGAMGPTAIERLEDASRLADLEVWPTLLDYELDGG